MSRLRTALRHIGGPASVTWQALLITLVISVVGYRDGAQPAQVPTVVLLAGVAVATLVGFVPLLLVYWWMRRQADQRPRPLLMLSMYVLMVAVRGIGVAQVPRMLGAPDELGGVFRVFSAMPALVLTLVLSAIVVGSTREYAARREQLAQVNAALAEAHERTGLAVAADQAKAIARIAAQLQDELDDLDPDRPAESAQQLQHLSNDVVRPLSHELARSIPTWEPTSTASETARVSARAVFVQASQGAPFAEIPTAASAMAMATGTMFSMFSPALAVGQLIVVGGGSLLLLVLLNVVLNAIPSTWPRWVRLVGLFVSAGLFAAALATYMYLATPDVQYRPRLAAATFVLTSIFSILFAVVKAYGELQVRYEASVRAQNDELRWAVARAHQVQWYQQRALSRLLHGPVQSTLDATAMRLDIAVREQQDALPVIESARTELRSLLADAAAARVNTVSVDGGVKRITELWSGLCEVDVVVDDDASVALAGDDICRMILIELLTEGASNAINHGTATSLRMRVALAGSMIAVTIDDNGTATQQRAEAGLGSRMLDECAVTWTWRQTEAGQRLEATLPIATT